MFKSTKQYLNRLTIILLCFAFLFSVPLCASAAPADFEKSISAFPESYKLLLRELHESHPLWEFVPMETGLDWNTAVNAEASNGRSLVTSSSAYANAFRSKEKGHYNYTTEKYIEKDGGFVTANKFAVSYFMDPRNFLNEENIFQFEDLSFDESFTVEAVDVVLSGTFMYNSKATYYTAKGEQKTSKETYAEMMYAAGKASNINPCYIAAKIRGEIGNGSGSVSGKNKDYPGIYNFYNIGASDGAGAIARGLKWASDTTSGTYNRPWTTPKKSIMGGAQFIANTYIAKGQYTGYLQKFNVNPNGYYKLYDHQYMTNVSGATSQGYSAYYSYLSIGMIDNRFVFSIPVYDNMPGEADNSGTIKLNDASSQTGVVDGQTPINVRTGPSTNYGKLPVQLPGGASVTILDCVKTDSVYYDSILRYPSWFKVKFKQNSQSYTGFVPAGFIQVKTKKTVPLGEYIPKITTDNKALSFNFISMDTRKATVSSDKKINFIDVGDVSIIAYDSSGRYSTVVYTVSDEIEPTLSAVDGINQSDTTKNSFTLIWNAVAGAEGYRVYMLDSKTNNYKTLKNTKATSHKVTDLSAGKNYKFIIRAYKTDKDGTKVLGAKSAVFTAVTNPPAPTAFKQSSSNSDSIMLTWKAVPLATGYEIYQSNGDSQGFKKVSTTTANAYSVASLSPSSDYKFKVRAIIKQNGQSYVGGFSSAITGRTGPAVVTNLQQKSATQSSVTLSWSAVKQASGYRIFKMDYSTFEYVLVGKTTKTSLVIDSLKPGQLDTYNVKAYEKVGSKVYYGTNSKDFTATTLPQQVKSVKQSSAASTSVKLSWEKVSNASGYGIYKLNDKGKYIKIASVASNEYTVTGLNPLSTYKFKIRSYIRSNKKVYWGDYSPVASVQTSPGAVTGLKKTAVNADSYKIKWTAQKNVSGYCVYVYISETKKYTKIATTTTNSVIISDMDNSEETKYAVRAFKKINGKAYYSDYSSLLTVK